MQAIEQVGFQAVMSQKWAETSEDVTIGTSPFGVEEAEQTGEGTYGPQSGLCLDCI